jgi:hypothetical protein
MPYNSIRKIHISQAMQENTLVAATNISIPPLDWEDVLFDVYYREYNHLSNLRIHNIGIFSNFADGLVILNPETPLQVGYTVKRMTESAVLSGTVNCTPSNKTVTGIGTVFTAEISAGDVLCEETLGKPLPIGIVDSVTNNTSLELTSYPLYISSGNPIVKLTEDSQSTEYINVDTFNQMYRMEDYINPADLSGSGEIISIQARVDHLATLDLARDAIASDFDGDTVFFTVHADLEYTPGS